LKSLEVWRFSPQGTSQALARKFPAHLCCALPAGELCDGGQIAQSGLQRTERFVVTRLRLSSKAT
jgi:hypothetical protein